MAAEARLNFQVERNLPIATLLPKHLAMKSSILPVALQHKLAGYSRVSGAQLSALNFDLYVLPRGARHHTTDTPAAFAT